MIKTYVKLPIPIEAVQWTGDNVDEIIDFTFGGREIFYAYETSSSSPTLIIHTLEGDHHASVGDYIIKGVRGEFYPCKPDIFEQTYTEFAGRRFQ